ncbi:alpha/beta fold hydrolase [Verrucomicrobiaceae bacterium 227]
MKQLLLLPFLFLLCQCGAPSAPRCHTISLRIKTPAPDLLVEAAQAWKEMSRTPSLDARARYNSATARLFDKMECGKDGWNTHASRIGTTIDRTHTLGTGLDLEDLDALVPASNVDVKGIGKRHQDPGIGLPLVGWKSSKTITDRQFEFAPPSGLPLNLTAILDFSKPTPTWRFIYGGQVPEVRIGRRSEPVAIDWSAPSALYWRMSDLDDLDLLKVFLPTRFTDHAGLFFATPYTSKKIPIVLVHGLNSSPGTYKALYNDLVGQKWFRDKYQVLFFSYPTGIAWPYNAAEFRRQLHRAQKYAASKGPLDKWENMVVIGHSMGGVISKASLIEPGDRFYKASYARPIEQLRVSETTRDAIRQVRLYEPLQSPSRAIFMAAPLQGAPAADRFIWQAVSSIIRIPKVLTIDFATATLSEISSAIQQGGQTRPPLTSIGTLSPNYRAYSALKDSPFRDGLTYHSIIGDRGKNDSPKSSDGIVPYWSAHLDGAASEKIVPASHSLTRHPATLAEVSRILQLHLKSQ